MQISEDGRRVYLDAEEIEQLQRWLNRSDEVVEPELAIEFRGGGNLLFELMDSQQIVEAGFYLAVSDGERLEEMVEAA